MATTSKTSGGKKITDKNREAERAKARAYAAKGKSKPTAKDMPYGWALPKATGGSSGPPTRAVLHSGRTSASGGPSTRGIKGGGSSGPPTRAKLNAGRKAKPKEEPKAATPAPTPKPKEEPKAATPAPTPKPQPKAETTTPAGRKRNSAPMLKQPSLNRTIDMSAVQGAATAATVAANKAGKPLVAAGEKVGKKGKALMARIAAAKRQGDEAKAALKAHNAKMEKELAAWKASKK